MKKVWTIFAALLFSLNGFAGEEVPCPGTPAPESPSSAPSTPSEPSSGGPSDSHVSTPSPDSGGGNVRDQMGTTFNPDQGGGGGNGLFDPKDITIGTNPLDHNLVRQYLKSVDKMIAWKKEDMERRKSLQREQRQKLTNMEERIKSKKDYLFTNGLRNWGNAMADQSKAHQRIDEIEKSFKENYDRKQELEGEKREAYRDRDRWDKIYEELRDLERQDSKLRMEMMDAVQKRDRADAAMEMKDESLKAGFESLREQVKEYEAYKRDVGEFPSDTQNASIPRLSK